MQKIANVLFCTLGIGAMGGTIWGAAFLLDRLLNIFA